MPNKTKDLKHLQRGKLEGLNVGDVRQVEFQMIYVLVRTISTVSNALLAMFLRCLLS